MSRTTFEKLGIPYEERDGIFYPVLVAGTEKADIDAGKYGRMWIKYIKEEYPMRYKSLVRFGELEERADEVNDTAYELLDDIEAKWLKKHKPTVIDQLQMEEVIDNKAVMIVGNYGTGKSHLMSVIAAIATDADNLAYVQNKKFGSDMEIVAGKFEVLRLKVDGLTMPLREVILAEIEDDFASRGIDYAVPDLDNVRDNARLIKEVMQAFQEKYPDKGYLIVIDELLSYLTSRDRT